MMREGVDIDKSCQDCVIDNCVFENFGFAAAVIDGGDKTVLKNGNNEVISSVIRNTSQGIAKTGNAIRLQGVGNAIRNCKIYNIPDIGIYFRGCNLALESCWISNICTVVDDNGNLIWDPFYYFTICEEKYSPSVYHGLYYITFNLYFKADNVYGVNMGYNRTIKPDYNILTGQYNISKATPRMNAYAYPVVEGENEEAAKDVAMQAAAMNPVALNRDSVPADVIAKELEIGREKAREEGKPEAILDRIAQGRLDKFFKESTLVEQEFIKDNKMTVGAYAKANNATPTAFKRVTLNQD